MSDTSLYSTKSWRIGSLAYGRGGTVPCPHPSDPKNKKRIKSIRHWRKWRGKSPHFKINWLCFLVTDIRATQFFLWLLHIPSAWFSFYDFILSLTKFLHTWLLSSLTQATMNTRKTLWLAWDLSPQTSSISNRPACLKLITSREELHPLPPLASRQVVTVFWLQATDQRRNSLLSEVYVYTDSVIHIKPTQVSTIVTIRFTQ